MYTRSLSRSFSGLLEHALDEPALDEHALDEHALDEHALDEHALDVKMRAARSKSPSPRLGRVRVGLI